MPVGRCDNKTDHGYRDPAADKALGVIAQCFPISAQIKKNPLQFFTDVLATAAQWGTSLPFYEMTWMPSDSAISFRIPNMPEYSSFSLCRLDIKVISEIPGQGNYLRAGWLRPTSPTVREAIFKLYLKRRPLGKGQTSYHADAYFAFAPNGNLTKARESKICQTEEELKNIYFIAR